MSQIQNCCDWVRYSYYNHKFLVCTHNITSPQGFGSGESTSPSSLGKHTMKYLFYEHCTICVYLSKRTFHKNFVSAVGLQYMCYNWISILYWRTQYRLPLHVFTVLISLWVNCGYGIYFPCIPFLNMLYFQPLKSPGKQGLTKIFCWFLVLN